MEERRGSATRDTGMVRGYSATVRDAFAEPSEDRVDVSDGTRGEDGACDVHGEDSGGGAHGMRGDAVHFNSFEDNAKQNEGLEFIASKFRDRSLFKLRDFRLVNLNPYAFIICQERHYGLPQKCACSLPNGSDE
jgi:hypothetical protein